MIIKCSCGKSAEFRKNDDIKTIFQAGWHTYGFDISKNDYHYLCGECANKLDDKIKLVLNIK